MSVSYLHQTGISIIVSPVYGQKKILMYRQCILETEIKGETEQIQKEGMQNKDDTSDKPIALDLLFAEEEHLEKNIHKFKMHQQEYLHRHMKLGHTSRSKMWQLALSMDGNQNIQPTLSLPFVLHAHLLENKS